MTTYIIVDYKAKITKNTNATKFSDFAFGSTFLGQPFPEAVCMK